MMLDDAADDDVSLPFGICPYVARNDFFLHVKHYIHRYQFEFTIFERSGA